MAAPLITTPVTVPLCYLPNSKSQTFDPATCLRSAFQVQTFLEISQRPDFAYFVCTGGEVPLMDPGYNSKIAIMWYAKDGTMHSLIAGRIKLLHNNTYPSQVSPTPLDSSVYTSRCN